MAHLINKILVLISGLTIATTTPMILKAPVYVQPVSDKWDIVIDKLVLCESNGLKTAYVHDDGGSPSYGILQWKTESFWLYNQRYKVLPDLEKKEIINIIFDPSVQKKLAKFVLQDGGGRNWYTCSKL